MLHHPASSAQATRLAGNISFHRGQVGDAASTLVRAARQLRPLDPRAARDTLLSYVDVFEPMLGANGRPQPALFVGDSLHMTPAGYAIWRAQVAPFLR